MMVPEVRTHSETRGVGSQVSVVCILGSGFLPAVSGTLWLVMEPGWGGKCGRGSLLSILFARGHERAISRSFLLPPASFFFPFVPNPRPHRGVGASTGPDLLFLVFPLAARLFLPARAYLWTRPHCS